MLEELIEALVMEVLDEGKPKTPHGPFKIGQFRNLKTYKERTQYLNTRDDANFISEGSSRAVFSIGGKMVVKISKWNRGKAQNKSEYDAQFCGNKKYLPKMFAQAANYSWIMVESVIPMKSARQFESMTGIPIRAVEVGVNFMSSDFKRRNPADKTYKKYKGMYEQLSKDPWYRGLVKMASDCDLVAGDLGKWDSWGHTKRGRVVLIDYGLTEGVWKQYYARTS